MIKLFKIEGDVIKAISNLLDSINNRINTISTQIDSIKNRRNYVLELENIFFNYQISKNDFKPEDLLKLSINDFSRIMEIMGEENIAELTEKFDSCKNIDKLYKSLVNDGNEIPEASQYEESLDWLQMICDVVMRHIQNYEADSTQNINILEKTITSLKEFSNRFKAGEMIEPVFDIEQLNDILNKSGLDLAEKVAIKKEVGIANYNLVIKNKLTTDDKNKSIEKYRLIYEKKSNAYKEEIFKVLELCTKEDKELTLENTLNDINYFVEKLPDYKLKAIQNAIVGILLKRELDTFENNNENIDETLNNCEKLLAYSRKNLLKETPKEQLARKDVLLIQGNDVINKTSFLASCFINYIISLN